MGDRPWRSVRRTLRELALQQPHFSIPVPASKVRVLTDTADHYALIRRVDPPDAMTNGATPGTPPTITGRDPLKFGASDMRQNGAMFSAIMAAPMPGKARDINGMICVKSGAYVDVSLAIGGVKKSAAKSTKPLTIFTLGSHRAPKLRISLAQEPGQWYRDGYSVAMLEPGLFTPHKLGQLGFDREHASRISTIIRNLQNISVLDSHHALFLKMRFNLQCLFKKEAQFGAPGPDADEPSTVITTHVPVYSDGHIAEVQGDSVAGNFYKYVVAGIHITGIHNTPHTTAQPLVIKESTYMKIGQYMDAVEYVRPAGLTYNDVPVLGWLMNHEPKLVDDGVHLIGGIVGAMCVNGATSANHVRQRKYGILSEIAESPVSNTIPSAADAVRVILDFVNTHRLAQQWREVETIMDQTLYCPVPETAEGLAYYRLLLHTQIPMTYSIRSRIPGIVSGLNDMTTAERLGEYHVLNADWASSSICMSTLWALVAPLGFESNYTYTLGNTLPRTWREVWSYVSATHGGGEGAVGKATPMSFMTAEAVHLARNLWNDTARYGMRALYSDYFLMCCKVMALDYVASYQYCWPIVMAGVENYTYVDGKNYVSTDGIHLAVEQRVMSRIGGVNTPHRRAITALEVTDPAARYHLPGDLRLIKDVADDMKARHYGESVALMVSAPSGVHVPFEDDDGNMYTQLVQLMPNWFFGIAGGGWYLGRLSNPVPALKHLGIKSIITMHTNSSMSSGDLPTLSLLARLSGKKVHVSRVVRWHDDAPAELPTPRAPFTTGVSFSAWPTLPYDCVVNAELGGSSYEPPDKDMSLYLRPLVDAFMGARMFGVPTTVSVEYSHTMSDFVEPPSKRHYVFAPSYQLACAPRRPTQKYLEYMGLEPASAWAERMDPVHHFINYPAAVPASARSSVPAGVVSGGARPRQNAAAGQPLVAEFTLAGGPLHPPRDVPPGPVSPGSALEVTASSTSVSAAPAQLSRGPTPTEPGAGGGLSAIRAVGFGHTMESLWERYGQPAQGGSRASNDPPAQEAVPRGQQPSGMPPAMDTAAPAYRHTFLEQEEHGRAVPTNANTPTDGTRLTPQVELHTETSAIPDEAPEPADATDLAGDTALQLVEDDGLNTGEQGGTLDAVGQSGGTHNANTDTGLLTLVDGL